MLYCYMCTLLHYLVSFTFVLTYYVTVSVVLCNVVLLWVILSYFSGYVV